MSAPAAACLLTRPSIPRHLHPALGPHTHQADTHKSTTKHTVSTRAAACKAWLWQLYQAISRSPRVFDGAGEITIMSKVSHH
jgi:hypothetical protein